MPQLTDRSKLPEIIDPVIKNTMDPKHLFQVSKYCNWSYEGWGVTIFYVIGEFIPYYGLV